MSKQQKKMDEPKKSSVVKKRPKNSPAHTPPTPNSPAHLQATFGNQALSRAALSQQSPSSPIVQPKLRLNAVGDKYEQEADSVAKTVMQTLNSDKGEETAVGEATNPTIAQRIQRTEAAPEDEEAMAQRQEMPKEEAMAQRQEDEEMMAQRQEDEEEAMAQRQEMPEEEAMAQRQEDEEEAMAQRQEDEEEAMAQRQEEEEEVIQAKRGQDLSGGGVVGGDVESRIREARGGGQPLNAEVRQPLEQAFGSNFGDVRVHHNAESSELNQSLQARAFTTGKDIFFKEGEYVPGSSAGQDLLAHELTHVVQQTGSVQREDTNNVITGPTINIVGDPNFYDKALRNNQFYSKNPPQPGWPYDKNLQSLWNSGAFDDFADEVRNLQEKAFGASSKNVDGILGPQTAGLFSDPEQEAPESLTFSIYSSIDENYIIHFDNPISYDEAVNFIWEGSNTPSLNAFRPYTSESSIDINPNLRTRYVIDKYIDYLIWDSMKSSVKEHIKPVTVNETDDWLPSWLPADIQEKLLNDTIEKPFERFAGQSLIGTAIVVWQSANQTQIYAELEVDPSILREKFDLNHGTARRFSNSRKYLNERMLELIQTGKSPIDAWEQLIKEDNERLRDLLQFMKWNPDDLAAEWKEWFFQNLAEIF